MKHVTINGRLAEESQAKTWQHENRLAEKSQAESRQRRNEKGES